MNLGEGRISQANNRLMISIHLSYVICYPHKDFELHNKLLKRVQKVGVTGPATATASAALTNCTVS